MSDRKKTQTRIVAVAGAVTGSALMLGLTVFLNDGGGFESATPASALGWTLPLGSLLVIVGVTWLLLSRTPKDPSADPSSYVPCRSCGRSVLPAWRMCPYCGALQDRVPDVEEAGEEG